MCLALPIQTSFASLYKRGVGAFGHVPLWLDAVIFITEH